MIDPEVIKKAQVVLALASREKQELEHNIAKKVADSLLGRYFLEDEGTYADKEGFSIYKVLHRYGDARVIVEKWKYAHSDFYELKLDYWYSDHTLDHFKELTSVEFYYYVTKFLKKIGAVQAITTETTH